MAKTAAPYQEGKFWSMRRRILGQDLYVHGLKSASAASQAMKKLVEPLMARGKPKGAGPMKTTLAQALQDFGRERLPFMKGAEQEARRINVYLRAAELATLSVKKVSAPNAPGEASDDSAEPRCFEVELQAPQSRKIPRGLCEHRRRQAQQTAEADRHRSYLARLAVADIKPYDVQVLMDELRKSRGASTVQLERALLRGFFNHARKVWCWSQPERNPAAELKMPKVDNARDRVMSTDEQQRLDEAIAECHNALVGPTLALLTETAMRAGEPIEYACWKDVDWNAKVLHLRDSKNDKRDVPLSPTALDALRHLAAVNPPEPDHRIVRMSYEALKAAWKRACERAGISDLRIHDLRHTAATRMALKSGNVFLVKALTGHKTMSQVQRYVNVKASDVVALLHAQPEASQHGSASVPAGGKEEGQADEAVGVEHVRVGNVVRVNFHRTRTATT